MSEWLKNEWGARFEWGERIGWKVRWKVSEEKRSAAAAMLWSKTQSIGSRTRSILVSRSVYFGPKLSPSHFGLKLSPSWSRDRSILLWNSVQVILLGLTLRPKSAFYYYQSLKPTRRTRLDHLCFYFNLDRLTCAQTFPFTLSHHHCTYNHPCNDLFKNHINPPIQSVASYLWCLPTMEIKSVEHRTLTVIWYIR